ncbi:MAG: 2-phosphosulfolactate phosphatase [Candidatus Bathyarchaeota archaeon]|nr:2-phosphosulfolactate phosphatase [Candidatus Bathyarchaeota archaeon]
MIRVETDPTAGLQASLRGDILIVIDVLRFSSSIVTGLATGAKQFIPVATLKKARNMHKKNRSYLLAGERKGLKPKDFHFGNSPIEYKKSNLKGKSIVISTTNGTKTIEYCKKSKFLLIASFLNAHALSTYIADYLPRENNVSIILASKSHTIFLEDFICAGLLVSNIIHLTSKQDLNDDAILAKLAWSSAKDDLEKTIRQGHHASYLESIGFIEDVKFCINRDIYDLIPFVQDNKISKINRG